MRDVYQAAFERLFRELLLQERERLKLTQTKMAELLLISRRAYSSMECGSTSCSTLTLVLFLICCCTDRIRFLQELEEAFRKAEEGAYASV